MSRESGSKLARLSSKIFLAMGSVLFLFALVTGLFLYISLNAPAGTVSVQPSKQSSQPGPQMKAALLEARNLEIRLYHQPSPELITRHKEVTAGLLDMADLFAREAQSSGDKKGLAAAGQIKSGIQQLDAAYADFVQAREAKGRDEHSGLLGELDKAGRQLEEVASRNDAGILAAGLLRIQRHQEEYLKNGKSVELQNIDSAINDFSRLLAKTGIDPVEAQILKKSLKEYSSALDRFQAVSLATFDPGLSASLGKEKQHQADDMRNALSTIESVITRVNVPDALTAVFAVRKAAAEYLLTGDKQSAGKVNEGLDVLAGKFSDSPILQEHRNQALGAVRSYRDIFTGLVAQDDRIQEAYTRLDQTVTMLQESIPASGTNALQSGPAARATANTARMNTLVMTGAIAGLATILLGLLAAVLLSRSIAAPIVGMTNIVRRITRERDFSVELPVSGTQETGSLAMELNNLLRIQETAFGRGQEEHSDSEARMKELSDIAHSLQDTLEQVDESSRTMITALAEQGIMADRAGESAAVLISAAESMNTVFSNADEQNTLITDAVEHIGRTVASTIEGIKAITTSSSKISDIINLSNQIAEQTNLLALNASVKAARAGSHGKEFAVIADEIAKLAQRSEEIAKEAGRLTVDLGARVDEAVKLGDETKQSLDQVHEAGRVNLASAEEMAENTRLILAGSRELGELAGEMAAAARETENIAMTQAAGCTASQESISSILEKTALLSGHPGDDEETDDDEFRKALDNIALNMDKHEEEVESDEEERDSLNDQESGPEEQANKG